MKLKQYFSRHYFIFILLAFFLLLIVAVGAFYFRDTLFGEFIKLNPTNKDSIEANLTDLVQIEEINQEPVSQEVIDKYNNYLVEGLKYKASGDAGKKADYYKAIDSFQAAIDLTEGGYWIPVVNIANIYKTLGEYEKSDQYYDKALEISGYSEQSVYLAKIDLHINYLKKDNDSVITLYEKAISDVVVDQMNLVVSYAGFLKKIEKYDESLKYYKILAENYPDNQLYQQEITWLESKIK